MKTIRLRAGKERSLQRRHPWIFESAIAKGGGDERRDGAGGVRQGSFWLGSVQPDSPKSAPGSGALMKISA
jgi:hypothetical protein